MSNDTQGINMSFDYIIIGSGPAGCVLAKELSESGRNTVLLLEAGENKDNDLLIRDSSASPFAHRARYTWLGQTVPQVFANNRSFPWTTGRLSGGGSSINGEQYVRPSDNVLKNREMLNGPMWGPTAAYNTFNLFENHVTTSTNLRQENNISRRFTGRLSIREMPEKVPEMTQKLVGAIVQGTGFETILNYNDPNTPIGAFYKWQLTQKANGDRESASNHF